MIVGIDETGDFNPRSSKWHFFVGALVQDAKLPAFDEWERSVGKEVREGGEIKGRLLSEAHLSNFVEQVLEADPVVRLRPLVLMPKQNPAQAIEAQRRASLALTRRSVDRLKSEGDAKTANIAEQSGHWMRKRADGDYLWLAGMTRCLAHCLLDVIGISDQLAVDELVSIRFAVDNKYIRRRNLIGITTAARGALSAILNDLRPRRNDVIGHRMWHMQDSRHPFAELCVQPDGQWHFLPLLLDRCSFDARSTDSPAVRIADVTATIYSRVNNEVAPSPLITNLFYRCERLVGPAGRQTHLIFARPAPPQPTTA